MVRSFVFSPSGTTAKVAGTLAGFIEPDVTTYDITVEGNDRVVVDGHDDVVVFAMPVYAGRIPALAAERLRSVTGNGQKAVAVVVYGNRDYDDALIELYDIANACGFNVIAAGAFIAQHCIFPKVAQGRPDADDVEKIAEFAYAVRQRICDNKSLDKDSVKGNRPYKKAASVPLHPDVDPDKCNRCGICATQCPAGAIDAEDPTHTDNSKCITCCRCINVCRQGARSFDGMIYKLAGWKFVKDNSRRLEPEWFI